MTDWLSQYSAALEARDAREQAHKQYIDAYTLLAEREQAHSESAPVDANVQTELVAIQKARAALANTLKDVEAQLSQLQAERQQHLAQIASLTKSKTDTERKLKDRDDELRGKATLVEHAQDEMIAQGLQLHLSEAKAEKLARENKDLVDRWMKRMEQEADKVNRDSRWS